MPDTITRGQVQHRSFAVRAEATGREFTGLGVPYGEQIEFWGWREQFAPGSVTESGAALILWRHDEPIGKVTSARDTDAGHEVTGRLSDTERGREAAELLRDGVITRMSIGFEPIEWTETEDGEITYTKVRAREFSLVPFPAYAGAAITDVRHRPTPTPAPRKDTTVTETLNRADLDGALNPLEDKLQDFERALARVESNTAPTGPVQGAQFRSMGHLLKALAQGDESAAEFHRAYAGGTISDDLLKETPVGDFTRWVNERTPTLNMFTRGTLPAEGMTLDFTEMPADQLHNAKVGRQVKEGDNLTGPFKVKIKDKSVPIETWGGWTELSRQRIERSQHNYLDKLLKVLGIGWARYAESRFAAFLGETLDARASAGLQLPATPDYTDYLGAIVDAGDYFAAEGYALDGLAMSPEKFKSLALTEAADGRPLMSVYGQGVNTTGVLNLPNGQGNLAGVPVRVLWNTTGREFFFDSSAVQIDMTPGAPAQLQDENIINLTKQFSIYGYAAMYAPFPGGLLPLTAATPAG